MSTTGRKPYKVRSGFAASFERDVVGATVDVSIAQLRSIAAQQLPAAAGSQWSQLSGNWSPDLCSSLTGFADGLALVTNVPKHAVAWVFTALAHAMGCPPFLAQIIGRLMANWLLAPLNPVDTAIRRIRVLGVLLCAESGDLGNCPCLVDLIWQVGPSELKKELDKGLGIAPDSSPVRPMGPTDLPGPGAPPAGPHGPHGPDDRRGPNGPHGPEGPTPPPGPGAPPAGPHESDGPHWPLHGPGGPTQPTEMPPESTASTGLTDPPGFEQPEPNEFGKPTNAEQSQAAPRSGLAAIQHACVVARGDVAPPVSLIFGSVI